MLIPESDLIHKIRIFSKSVAQGPENEPVYNYLMVREIAGLVVPRSARMNRETREYVEKDYLVLTEYAPDVVEGQVVRCVDQDEITVLVGEIVYAEDPNLIHDHLELTVRKGAAPFDV